MLYAHRRAEQKGGVLGKKLEAVVVDPASNWPLSPKRRASSSAKDKVPSSFG